MRSVLVFAFIFSLGFPAAAFAAEKLPPGFIALSGDKMSWPFAKAFCHQQGGRLPYINNSDSWVWNANDEVNIDGFGAWGAPWPSGLSNGFYWTGTKFTNDPGRSWVVSGGDYIDGLGHQSSDARVVCVPLSAEEERRAREEFKRKFIALSETSMTWSDAKAFCQQQGGRLPRINDSDSWSASKPVTHIDGFGAPGAPGDPWPSGLPGDYYWSGTEITEGPGTSWLVGDGGGHIVVGGTRQSNQNRAACVPK